MKKILCLIIALFTLSGCASVKKEESIWKSIVDDTGYEVVLKKKPEKVAVLFSSYAEIWTLAGGDVKISVRESIDRGFCDENIIIVDDKSGHTHIDTELLIKSEPDLVIGTTDYDVQTQTAQLCRDAGIPVALFKVESFADYSNVLFRCSVLTDEHEKYVENSQSVKDDINSLFKEITVSENNDTIVTGEKILFVRAGSAARSTKAKTKEENFVCKMLDELKTYNIAENAPILLDGLSIEEIIKEDPKHIFVATMGDEEAAKEYVTSLLKEEGWNSIEAVEKGNVHFLPKELFHYKPNNRWGEAYEYLAGILYPEIINE